MTSVMNIDRAITLKPSMWQFVTDELPMIGLVIASYIYIGIDCTPLKSVILLLAVIMTLCLIYRLMWYRRLVYRITGEQIIIRKGVFTRSCDYIELYRVIDFSEHKSFMQQLLGLKTVHIYSGDRTTPKLDIIGVRSRLNLVEVVRMLVEQNKQRKGIYEITNR